MKSICLKHDFTNQNLASKFFTDELNMGGGGINMDIWFKTTQRFWTLFKKYMNNAVETCFKWTQNYPNHFWSKIEYLCII